MGIFSDLNEQLTSNMLRHGHYLTNPNGEERTKLEETVEILLHFVEPSSRDEVKSRITEIIYENRRDSWD